MAGEFGPVPGPLTSEATAPVILPEPTSIAPPTSPDPLGDNIVQREATINPALLKPERVAFEVPLVNGRPPGYLSVGDRIILERYSKGYKEPPLGIHNPNECPDCVDNGNGSK